MCVSGNYTLLLTSNGELNFEAKRSLYQISNKGPFKNTSLCKGEQQDEIHFCYKSLFPTGIRQKKNFKSHSTLESKLSKPRTCTTQRHTQSKGTCSLTLVSISAALSVLPEKRGRRAGSFPEQRLVIEPKMELETIKHTLHCNEYDTECSSLSLTYIKLDNTVSFLIAMHSRRVSSDM